MNSKNVNVKKTAKKNKLNLKKIKKVLLTLLRKIAKKIKALWDKFMSLPEKTRYIVYVWSGVLLIIIIMIAASNGNNVFLKDYHNLEKSMNTGAVDYATTYSLYPTKENKLKIDLEILKEDNYVYPEDIKDKSCIGFSLIYYDDADEKYVTDSYIHCDKYTTEGYRDYK